MNFKERWEQTDKKCPECNQVTERVRGITRQNIKRLLIPTWNLNEAVITFLLIMILVLGYAYIQETKESREWLKTMKDNPMECEKRCELIRNNGTISVTAPYVKSELNTTILNELVQSS